MRIVVAEPVGFCFGVKRALRLAHQARRQFPQVWTYGALIHNPGVVAELERKGIHAARSLRRVQGGALVIRSHGCPPEVLRAARRRGITVVDATCPHVRRVQQVVRDLKSAGYLVIIAGEQDHPEVQSLLGCAETAGRVFAPNMKLTAKKLGIVAQTTVPLKTLQTALAELGRGRFEELRVFNTICAEAASRQAAAAKIAQDVDLMVVIGGRNSANTSRLADIARAAGKRTYQVENEKELNPGWFEKARRVGVTAGTSTPSWVVDKVLAELRALRPGSDSPGKRRSGKASALRRVGRDKITKPGGSPQNAE